MSNVSALIKGRSINVTDGVYIERAQEREPVLEEYLRALMARSPKLKSRSKQVKKFVAEANAAEAEIHALDDAGLVDALNATCIEMRQYGFTDKLLARAFAAVR